MDEYQQVLSDEDTDIDTKLAAAEKVPTYPCLIMILYTIHYDIYGHTPYPMTPPPPPPLNHPPSCLFPPLLFQCTSLLMALGRDEEVKSLRKLMQALQGYEGGQGLEYDPSAAMM